MFNSFMSLINLSNRLLVRIKVCNVGLNNTSLLLFSLSPTHSKTIEEDAQNCLFKAWAKSENVQVSDRVKIILHMKYNFIMKFSISYNL